MANSTLGALTAATAATGGLFYGTQSGADRKFTFTAAGATLIEAANVAAQRTALAVLPIAGGTLTGALINSTNGAVSAPVLSLTGTTYSGGTATTTKPTFLVEPTGTTSTGWSTAGTLIGANAATGFTGNLMDLQLAGSSQVSVTRNGVLNIGDASGFYNSPLLNLRLGSGTCIIGTNGTGIIGLYQTSATNFPLGIGFSSSIGLGPDTILNRSAAASLQLGVNHATTATAQTIKAHDVTTGTGASLTLRGGTGSVASGGVTIGANGTASVLIRHGTATLASGTVTVSDTNIVAGSRIFVTRQTDGGTIGDSYSITRSAGTSFTITSKTANVTVTGDTSTVSYLIINP